MVQIRVTLIPSVGANVCVNYGANENFTIPWYITVIELPHVACIRFPAEIYLNVYIHIREHLQFYYPTFVSL